MDILADTTQTPLGFRLTAQRLGLTDHALEMDLNRSQWISNRARMDMCKILNRTHFLWLAADVSMSCDWGFRALAEIIL